MKKDPKVIIIGLDAATWTLIRPWMAEGGMPNLAKLMKDGCVRNPSVGPSANYSTGMDFVHDR